MRFSAARFDVSDVTVLEEATLLRCADFALRHNIVIWTSNGCVMIRKVGALVPRDARFLASCLLATAKRAER